MKKLFVIFTLISILSLSFYSILRADIFRGKAGAMFNKNGMKEKIIDSTTKIPEAVTFSSPASGEVIYINSVTVKGTVTGRIDSVSVLLDSGAWQTASGVATWQYVFSGLTNGTHTVKAKAINSKGTGPEATRTFTVDCTPQVSIIAGPSSSLSTNQTFVVTLSADRDHGYWSTNGSTFYEFNTGTTNISIDRSMVLRFYGKGITSHTSATQIRNYTIDLTPYVSIVSGPTASFLSTNNTFNIRLSVTKNSGYWSTNGSIFHSFPKGTTNLPIVSTTTLRYYGNDGLSHISSTQKKIYVLDLSPRITISSGPTNSTVETNHSFSIQLSADKSFGYWSTNGSIFNSFPAGTANLSIISTTTLRYYGNDGTHTSATQKKIYIINDAPKVTIVTGPSHDLTTNQPFIVKLRVNTNSGYWSTNNSGFYSFPKGTTNLSIISTTTLRYFGFNGIHTSLTQKRVYILDYIAPHVTIISGPSNSYNTNAGCSVTLSADENYGYWSTNGSTYISFPFGTKTFAITKNTKLMIFA